LWSGEAQGWLLKPPVPGFSLSSCTLRSLNAGHAARTDAPTLQAVFTDGLTQVSLFIDRVGAAPARRALSTQTGATHTLMQPLGSVWWITLMGVVPLSTLTQFFHALERRP
jgi:sigma-E factor negative regulatory protein RseB